MPCHGQCLVTIVNEVGVRPYGEFYYELIATGRNSQQQIIGFNFNNGLYDSHLTAALFVEGKVYKLGEVEWVDMDKPRGEWEAFYNKLVLRSSECELTFNSKQNFGDSINHSIFRF